VESQVEAFWFVLAFFVLLILLVSIRQFLAGRLEISNADVIAAACGVLFYGLFSGHIQSFKAGDIEVVSAIRSAKKEPIKNDLSSLATIPYEERPAMSKGGAGEIERMLAENINVLEFRFGYSGYIDSVIEEYFDQMGEWSALYGPYYVLFSESNGAFFGIVELSQLTRAMMDYEDDNLADIGLSRALKESRYELIREIPEVHLRDIAVKESDKRLTVLEKMDATGATELPVVRDDRFVGFVDRDRLGVNLILSIAKAG
jgi:CBS domain-containing protein